MSTVHLDEMMPPGGHFIANEFTSGAPASQFETIDPSTETAIAAFPCGTRQDIDRAVSAASDAFEGKWGRLMPQERGQHLYELARALKDQLETFARLEAADTGKPLQKCRSEIMGSVNRFMYYAGAADKVQGETIPLGKDFLNYTIREPIGVSAQIVPWNVPLAMVARGIAPALAAGNTVVVKPAEQSPLTALKLGELFRSVGFPAGVYNVVTGLGEEAGAALASHPEIGNITFTGSVETGRSIMKAAAEHIKPVLLELGGKSPQLVFPDCDLDRVVPEIGIGIFANTGQYCDAGSRLVVASSIKDALLERLISYASDIKIGPPVSELDMGPLISAEQHRRVLSYIEVGKQQGATLVCGGNRPDELDRGYYVQPTIFDGVKVDMRIFREEIFGPVLAVSAFADEEEALALANDTAYGLAAGIYTSDIDRALRVANRIRAGVITINRYFAGGVGSPFGGYKQSGIGRENGLIALQNYTQVKSIVADIRH